MRILRTLLLAALAFLYAAPAWAVLEIDFVVLDNGDRFTGEVKYLSRGQLQIKTNSAGTITIYWKNVVSISTLLPFDVEFYDGSRLLGRLDAAASDQIVVVDVGGNTLATVPLMDIVSLTPIRAGFFQKIDGSMDLGGSYTQSSGVAQIYFETVATYMRPAFESTLNVSATLTKNPDADDSQRSVLQYGYNRFRPSGWVVSPIALVESNPDLGFDVRYTGAMTLGRPLRHTNRSWIRLAGGAALGKELPIDEDPVTNVDALLTFGASIFGYSYPKTNVDLGLLVFASLNDPGRVRTNANVKVRREVFRNLFLAASAYDAFDNEPTSDNANTNDISLSLSLGWTF